MNVRILTHKKKYYCLFSYFMIILSRNPILPGIRVSYKILKMATNQFLKIRTGLEIIGHQKIMRVTGRRCTNAHSTKHIFQQIKKG